MARSVTPGDTVLVMMGHSRWTAAARELARQFWGSDPGFTLVMTSLGALSAPFFEGGLVRKVVTAYSGNSFPTYTPNPVFRQAYESGAVEVEHWSILTLSQRLEAAARGLPAAVTGSLVGSSMADNDAFTVVDSPFGPLGPAASRSCPTSPWCMRRRLTPPATWCSPNRCSTACGAPGRPGAASWPPSSASWTTSRASATVCGSRVTGCSPSWRRPTVPILAGVTRPACPSAVTARTSPTGARRPTPHRRASSMSTCGTGCSGRRRTRTTWPASGPSDCSWLEGRSDPMSWKADADAHPVVEDPSVTKWEQAASLGAREVEQVVDRRRRRRRAGRGRRGQPGGMGGRRVGRGRPGAVSCSPPSSACGGMSPRRPIRTFSTSGSFLPRPTCPTRRPCSGWSSVAPARRPWAAWVPPRSDRDGSLNSTELAGGRFLVGSGGANDVASRATACVVVTLARPERLPETVAYVTSPGPAGGERRDGQGNPAALRRRAPAGGGARRGWVARRAGACLHGVVRLRAGGGS